MRLKYLEKANGLLEQILKIDPKNEKALLRKCGVLVDLGGLKECEELLERLNVIAFDSAKSQAVYMEIKKIKQRMEDKKNGKIPTPTAQNQRVYPPNPKVVPKKNGFVKENDWYY